MTYSQIFKSASGKKPFPLSVSKQVVKADPAKLAVKKADLTNAAMVSEGLGIKQDRKRVRGTMGMTMKACATPEQKKPLALKTDAERMLGF